MQNLDREDDDQVQYLDADDDEDDGDGSNTTLVGRQTIHQTAAPTRPATVDPNLVVRVRLRNPSASWNAIASSRPPRHNAATVPAPSTPQHKRATQGPASTNRPRRS